MKNIISKIFILTILLNITFCFNSISTATENIDNDKTFLDELATSFISELSESKTSSVSSNEEQQENLFKFSTKNITTTEYINGDAFICSAGTVNISSAIRGNVFVCAPSVIISENATINGSLFACTKDLNIYGCIEQNSYVASSSFILNENAYIGLDLYLTTKNATLNGYLYRNVFATIENLTLSDSAKIFGDFKYSSQNEFTNLDSYVEGNVIYNIIDTEEDKEETKNYFENKETTTSSALTKIIKFVKSAINYYIITLILFLIYKKIAPQIIKNSDELKHNTFKYYLIGTLFFLIIPIISIILLFTTVMLSISLLAITIFIIMALIGTPTFVISINNAIVQKYSEKLDTTFKQCIALFAISLIYKAILLIPILNIIITTIVCNIGVGIILKSLSNKK